MGMTLEIELGITGGEDGVDNSDVDSSKLYNLMKLHLLTRRLSK
jgi:fructose/tagatose bisphosphate aldolase